LPKHLYCGHTIASNTFIHELPVTNNDEQDFWFYLQNSTGQLPEIHWSYYWYSSMGDQVLAYCKENLFYWLRFPDLADFQISVNVKKIHCFPLPDTPEDTVRHLLLDQVLPRCLAHRGKLMVHASAVKLEEGLIFFLGESGGGKSTIAGNFHQAGQQAVSDDCLWLREGENGIKAIPAYAGLRLWEDSLETLFPSEQKIDTVAHYSTKKRVILNQDDPTEYQKGIPVLAMFVLAQPDQASTSDVTLESLSNREAFIGLTRQCFQLDVMDIERSKRHMQALGRIVPRLSAYRLFIPHDYELLPIARDKIFEALSKFSFE
jgi:hypothetical protein